MGRLWTHIVPVWVLTALGVIWVGLAASEETRVSSLVAVLAASVLASFVLQIVAFRSGGLVKRLTLAVTGSTVITLSASALFAVLTVVD
jgi:ABC-type polysaccharide/polyol phosphate export permease